MNPKCTKCEKTVYPVEKIFVLDQNWHKACFCCEICNMTLNVKNYKAFSKKPYCSDHWPTIRKTAVGETPDNIRLKHTSKQSKDILKKFEEDKGNSRLTTLRDDPDRLRQAKSEQIASSSGYKLHTATMKSQLHARRDDPEVSLPSHVPPPRPKPLRPMPQTPASQGPPYIAKWDYKAADEDEVSFNKDDIIIEVTVYEGWIEGRVQRTGEFGMLPSHYVEKQD